MSMLLLVDGHVCLDVMEAGNVRIDVHLYTGLQDAKLLPLPSVQAHVAAELVGEDRLHCL